MPVHEYAHAFPPLLPPDEVVETAEYLLDKCPVTHSSVDGGFWVLNRYEDVFRAFKERETFLVGRADGNGSLRVPWEPPGINRPLYPPIDLNPPDHRVYRNIINPFLTPRALEKHEAGFRRIITSLIDDWAADRQCDFAGQFAKIFPARITFEELYQIHDEVEMTKVRDWIRSLTYDIFRKDAAYLGGLQQQLNTWTKELIEARRRRPAEIENVLDALIQAQIDGAPILERDLVAAIQILILGGFSTTADASCNLVIALIENPGMEDHLRANPSAIMPFIEEVLRLDPPLTTRPRRCDGTARIGDADIHHGDRLLLNLVAANRDAAEFPKPDRIDLTRRASRHLSFGAGVHRCVGSTMARQTLHAMLTELLSRIRNIRYAPGDTVERVSYSSGVWRAVDHLAIEFDS